MFTLQRTWTFQQHACPPGLTTTRSKMHCGSQKREDPIVFPRPGLLVCRKEGLTGEIASEVPWWHAEFTEVFAQRALRERRSTVTRVGFVTLSKS